MWPFGQQKLFAQDDDDEQVDASNSLFLEILDWMLAPLLLLWPISIGLTNHYAHQIANQPYDSTLIEAVRVLSQYAEHVEGALPERLPRQVMISLAGGGADSRYFRMSSLDSSVSDVASPSSEMSQQIMHSLPTVQAHSPTFDLHVGQIPLVTDVGSVTTTEVKLRDDVLDGESVRVAYRALATKSSGVVLVQVAETRNEREVLVSRIIRGVLLPQFAMIPIVVILSYLGLSRGLAPLRTLRQRILGRRPGDLSPLCAGQAPEEVQPLLIALNGMMGRLEQNLQAQQRFIADAAHQMKTPLTGLKMQADLASTESDPVRLRHSLVLIAQSANRAAHLTNQLLTLARTEASHDKLHRFEPVDIRALAWSVTMEWAERAMLKEIDLAFEANESALMSEGVPLLLREMISNLIDNAIKYTPRGGRVTVRVYTTEVVVLDVVDTGIGIPESERGKVFERFYRVLGSEESGSGLGLPIVQEIVDLHQAHVELLEGESGGCLFRVALIRPETAINPNDLWVS
jgi:two-component system, OmpR family, sensor histidine kinase TctE